MASIDITLGVAPPATRAGAKAATALGQAWLRLQFQLTRLAGRPPPRVVFLHIPKCGGTSINHHFKSNFGGARSGMSVQLDSMTGSAGDAASLDRAKKAFYVAGHFGWSAMDAFSADATRFTVVRDPFERLRSLFQFVRGSRRLRHPTFAKVGYAAARMDFAEFCLSEDPEVRALVDNAMARTLASNYFPFAEENAAATVQAANAHLDALDFIIEAKRISIALPRLAAATKTTLLSGHDWLNRSQPAEKSTTSRKLFLNDRCLSARIACDLEVYEHARRRAL
jgi:hypothetical protein